MIDLSDIMEEKSVEPVRHSRTFNDFLNGLIWAVVGFLLIFVGMLYMTKISGSGGLDIKNATIETLILYILTVSISLLVRTYAKRKGRTTAAYLSTFDEVAKNNELIVSSGAAAKITDYCRQWETAELNNAREHILPDAGISLDTFNSKYLKYTVKEIKVKYPELTEGELKAICRAKRVKRLKYNENYLSVYTRGGRRKSPSGYLSVKAVERLNVLRILATVAFTSFLGVYITVELITDISFATVVMCLIKVATMIVSGATNVVGGYNVTAVKAVDEMRIKINEQKKFLKWCNSEGKQP